MISLALLLQLAAPTDFNSLPVLQLVHRTPDQPGATSLFVRDEIRAGRCVATVQPVASSRVQITVDVAVLVHPTGAIRAVVPRAIGCPSVEQYAAGLISRIVRGNVPPPGAERWFRTPITFSWAQAPAQ